ncbi:MAG: sulfatase-like hydrolase/transferase [Phycisphaeraceae bacterium]
MRKLIDAGLWRAVCLIGCLFTTGSGFATTDERPPNLIIILTDDQGWWDVGFNGCTDIPTPNLDRIANEGVRFSAGYVSHSVCGPSRAGLITGRYQDRFGASRNPTVDPSVPNNGVPRGEKMISELLKPRGYATMAVGKWHLGTHPDLTPDRRGFDEFYGFLSGGHDYFPQNLVHEDLTEVRQQWGWYRTKLLHNGKRVATDDYLTDELSDMAVDFVERKKDQPFFLYLAYNAPHTPMQATQKYLDRFPHIEHERRRTYAAMVSAVDDGVGRLLDTLDKLEIADDTLVVFLSDNGGASNNASRNRPLRGNKGSMYEGGLRVPFAMRWPGKIPAGLDYEHPVISLDIAATIAAHAKADVPDNKPLDGVDLIPYLSGEVKGPPHDALYWRMFDKGSRAMRLGDHKLVLDRGTAWQLYNLGADIKETNDLSGRSTAEVKRLLGLYEQWESQMVEPAYPGLGNWTFDKKK